MFDSDRLAHPSPSDLPMLAAPPIPIWRHSATPTTSDDTRSMVEQPKAVYVRAPPNVAHRNHHHNQRQAVALPAMRSASIERHARKDLLASPKTLNNKALSLATSAGATSAGATSAGASVAAESSGVSASVLGTETEAACTTYAVPKAACMAAASVSSTLATSTASKTTGIASLAADVSNLTKNRARQLAASCGPGSAAIKVRRSKSSVGPNGKAKSRRRRKKRLKPEDLYCATCEMQFPDNWKKKRHDESSTHAKMLKCLKKQAPHVDYASLSLQYL